MYMYTSLKHRDYTDYCHVSAKTDVKMHSINSTGIL